MTPSTRTRIFKSFSRGSKWTSEATEAAAWAFVVCRRLIELLGRQDPVADEQAAEARMDRLPQPDS